MSKLFLNFSSVENLQLAYKHVKNELENSRFSLLPINNGGITAIYELGIEFFQELSDTLRRGQYQPESTFISWQSKDNLDLRPIYALSTIDRIVYQSLLNPNITGAKQDILLENFCYGNRLASDSEIFLKPYPEQWNSFYRAQVEAFKNGYIWRASFDITCFFENIEHKRLIQELEKINIDGNLLEVLKFQLLTWAQGDNMFGLPQGPNASWILANFYLRDFDSKTAIHCNKNDLHFFRYADDMVIMAKSRGDILSYIENAAQYLRDISLNINTKTHVKEVLNLNELQSMQFGPSGDEDSLPLVILANKAHEVLNNILLEKEVSSATISELRGFLARYLDYVSVEFHKALIHSLEYKPSLIDQASKFLVRSINMMRFLHTNEDQIVIEELFKCYEECKLSNLRKWIFKILIEVVELNTVHGEQIELIIKNLFKEGKEPEEILLGCWYRLRNGVKITYQELLMIESRFDKEFIKGLLLFFSIQLQTPDVTKLFTLIKPYLKTSSEGELIGMYLEKKGIIPSGSLQHLTLYKRKEGSERLNTETLDKSGFRKLIIEGNNLNIYDSLGVTKAKKSEHKPKKPRPFVNKGRPQLTIGKLVLWTDGRITYDDHKLDLRPQLKDLCCLFMSKNGDLVTHDDIVDTIVNAPRRLNTDSKTIAKYVSDLRIKLRPYYLEKILFKSKSKEGWYIQIPK